MTPLLRPIVARINGLTAEIKRIKADKKLDNSKKQYTLAHLKTEARHTMLAYAFIRRIPYSVVEEKCNEKPSLYHLERILGGLNVSRKKTWTLPDGKVRSVYRETFTDTTGLTEWLNFPDDHRKKATEPEAIAPTVSLAQSFIDSIKRLVGAQ